MAEKEEQEERLLHSVCLRPAERVETSMETVLRAQATHPVEAMDIMAVMAHLHSEQARCCTAQVVEAMAVSEDRPVAETAAIGTNPDQTENRILAAAVAAAVSSIGAITANPAEWAAAAS